MARPTQLRVMGERPTQVEAGSPMAFAEQAQQQQDTPTQPLPLNGDGDRIVAYLKTQLGERDRLLGEERSRADTAETAAIQATQQIEAAYGEAAKAVRAAQQETGKAKQEAQQKAGILTTIGLGIARQIVEKFTWLLVFLLNRMPSLGALYGGYLLWDSHLSQVNPFTLIGLALYGMFIVLPTTWLAVKTTGKDET